MQDSYKRDLIPAKEAFNIQLTAPQNSNLNLFPLLALLDLLPYYTVRHCRLQHTTTHCNTKLESKPLSAKEPPFSIYRFGVDRGKERGRDKERKRGDSEGEKRDVVSLSLSLFLFLFVFVSLSLSLSPSPSLSLSHTHTHTHT